MATADRFLLLMLVSCTKGIFESQCLSYLIVSLHSFSPFFLILYLSQWGEGHPIRLLTILDHKQQSMISATITEQVLGFLRG